MFRVREFDPVTVLLQSAHNLGDELAVSMHIITGVWLEQQWAENFAFSH